jgi:ankyrin repeat protein
MDEEERETMYSVKLSEVHPPCEVPSEAPSARTRSASLLFPHYPPPQDSRKRSTSIGGFSTSQKGAPNVFNNPNKQYAGGLTFLHILAAAPMLAESARKNIELAKKTRSAANKAVKIAQQLIKTAKRLSDKGPVENAIGEILSYENHSEDNVSRFTSLSDEYDAHIRQDTDALSYDSYITPHIKQATQRAVLAIRGAAEALTISQTIAREMRDTLFNLSKLAKDWQVFLDDLARRATSAEALAEASDKNVKESEKEGRIVLVRASESAATAHQLMQGGALPNIQALNRKTPLRIGIETGNIDFVNICVENQNVDLDIRHEDENTFVHLAARLGHVDIVKTILTKAPFLVNAPNHKGNTPFHVAVEVAHLHMMQTHIIKLLYSFGANPSLSNNDGISPLILVQQMVLEENENTPSLASMEWRRNEMLRILTELSDQHEKGNTPLHTAADKGDLESARLFATINPSQVYDKNHANDSAICLAVRAGHLPIVELLITFRAAVFEKNLLLAEATNLESPEARRAMIALLERAK